MPDRLRQLLAALSVLLAVFGALCASGCTNNPYPPPDGKKVIYASLGEDPHGLDPVQCGDTLSGAIVSQIYDSLYEYHYLKRPYELKPALAAEMPQVSEDGLTYTIPIKRGVYFQDDSCFEETGGKGRELVAQDFVYSIKRLADQANDPRGWWTVQGKIAGLDEFHEMSAERTDDDSQSTDYSMHISGLEAPDRYTLRITLKERYPQFKYILAMPYTAAVPREAVEKYGDDLHNRPVGTGAFRLKQWDKRWRLILERNPTYRKDRYPSEGEPGDREAGLLEDAGRLLPLVDEVYYSIMYEAQPSWLLFKQGYLDASGISTDHFKEAITPEKELSPEFKEKGVRLAKVVEAAVFYVAFNMEDPLLGENPKLRKAMSLAYDTQWRIEHFFNGRAISAQGPIPPGIFGYDPDFNNPYKGYDLERARRLLAEAGYPGGMSPDGEPLTISYDIGSGGPAAIRSARAFEQDMEQIGIRVEIKTNTWNEFLRKLDQRSLQVFSAGWLLDYPDPENFLQLLYGPNEAPAGSNNALYDNPEYNRLYEKMKVMPNNEERLEVIRRMVDIVVEDAPWIPGFHRISYVLYHRWYENVKPTDMTGGFMKYRDVDVDLRGDLRRRWNRPNYQMVAAIVLGLVAVGFVLARFRKGSVGK